MALDLTDELLAGYDDGKAGRTRIANSPTLPGIANDIGYFLGSRDYPRPKSANASRGARQVRVKWSIPDMVNVVRCGLGGIVWEWVNKNTIRRA